MHRLVLALSTAVNFTLTDICQKEEHVALYLKIAADL